MTANAPRGGNAVLRGRRRYERHDFLRALRNAASSKVSDGLLAVFAYGYQQGRNDAAKASRKEALV